MNPLATGTALNETKKVNLLAVLKQQATSPTSLKQAFDAQVEQLNHVSNRLNIDGTRLNDISHMIYNQAASFTQLLNVIRFQDESIKKLNSRFNSQFYRLNQANNLLANQTKIMSEVLKIVIRLDNNNYYPSENAQNVSNTILTTSLTNKFQQANSPMCKLERIIETNDDMNRPLIVARNGDIIRGCNRSIQVKRRFNFLKLKMKF